MIVHTITAKCQFNMLNFPNAFFHFPQLVMSGGSCLNQTYTVMSTDLVTLLWLAMGEC